MKKILLVITLLALISTTVSAAEVESKKPISSGFENSDIVFGGPVGCDLYDTVPLMIFRSGDGKAIKGKIEFENWDSSKVAEYDLRWTFTPDDPSYETKTGIIKIKITEPLPDQITDVSEAVEQPTVPSLTATTVSLNTLTSYDINLDNKVSGSTYAWTSSDPDTVEVNAKSGYLKAKKEGKATITCEVTLPDQSKQYLSSVVTVGYDENAPLLTETNLDLETGDVFDINLENKVAKSKYRWVSSDKSVVKVNSANGKVTAIGEGAAFVTCTITTPEKQIIVLRCDINVTAPAVVTE